MRQPAYNKERKKRPMNRFILLTVLLVYYATWLLLPVFDLDQKLIIFPIPSIYAVYLPIVLLIIGFMIVGSFLGAMLLLDSQEKLKSN